MFLCHYQCLCALFLTQSKSVITDSIKELLSRKVIIFSSCLRLPVTKKKWNVNTCKGNMKKEIEHVDSASLNIFSYWLVESVKGRN